MPETKNPMTMLAEEVAEEMIARAKELAKTLEIPTGMERVGGKQAYRERYQKMTPEERMAERQRVGDENLAALLRGGE